MKKILIITLLLLSIAANATTYYVAPPSATPAGSDANAGTITAPWSTFQKAAEIANAGDTVYFRGGIWYPVIGDGESNSLVYIYPDGSVGHNGTYADPICFFNYPNETPIFDCRNMVPSGGYLAGINLYAAHHIKFRGITIRNLWQKGITMEIKGVYGWLTSNLHFERMTLTNVSGRAYNIWGGMNNGGSGITYDSTYFINCDASHCMDTTASHPGNFADGWKIYSGFGSYYYFEGCRAWNNSDDGFDIGGPMYSIFKNCWSWYNGFLTNGDGDGWKNYSGIPLGVDTTSYPIKFLVGCLAAYNSKTGIERGFTEIDGSGYFRSNARVYNCTAYKNGRGFVALSNIYKSFRNTVYRNNLSYQSIYSQDGHTINVSILQYPYPESNNSWDYYAGGYGFLETDTVTITDADFVSVDSTGISGARQSDGSLPDIDFLKLAPTSDLIDAGIQIPLSDAAGFTLIHYGASPDMGYSEYEDIDSTATNILTFTLAEQTGAATINTTTHTVSIEVTWGADVTDLTPIITLDYGATVSPLSGVSRDFTSPFVYTVTALNETDEQAWTVTVTAEATPATGKIIKYKGKIVKR
jgi:hypothetical protein